jgi:hypothetical protein
MEDVRRPRGGATSSPPWGRGEAPAREAQAKAAPGELQGWDGRDAWAIGVGGSRVVHKGHGTQAADISQAAGMTWRSAPGRRPRVTSRKSTKLNRALKLFSLPLSSTPP